MKFFFLSLAFISVESFANTTVCNYLRGETYSRNTGLRVSRSFQPKVLPGIQRIELSKRNDNIVVRPIQNNLYYIQTYTKCTYPDLTEGFDCYEGEEMYTRRLKKIYISADKKTTYLSEELGIPGGAYALDQYSCF